MKKSKKIIAAAAALSMVMTMSGFSGATMAASTAKATSSVALKIAIVTSPSGVDDGSFNEDNYNGILAFIKKNPKSKETHVRETTGVPAAAVTAVQNAVANNDVIVCPGYQFSGISKIALLNPTKKFILIDTTPDAVGTKTTFSNIYSMTFAEQESGFCAGMAAALQTKTNKVAVVNGIAYPSNVNYQYGFMSGVNYADKKYGKKAKCIELASYAGTDVNGKKVGGNYIASFSDEATGKKVGSSLIQKGCDILFVAAGASGNGVFTAVKEAKGVKVIGCDVDQYADGKNGSTNIVLTSVLKVMNKNVHNQLNKIANHTFKGGNELLTASTDSTGYVSQRGHQQLSTDTLKKLSTAYALLKSGKIVPAANFNGYTPTNFPGIPGYIKK